MRSVCTHSGPRRVRAIFFSDTHLGSRYARADELLSFLERYDPEYVYIVGDFIDGWSLRRSWRWQPTYNQILQLLFGWAQSGVRVRYTPGNHDEFLRGFLNDFGLFEISNQFFHRRLDGRRYLVTHGDQFEKHASHAAWQMLLGGLAYDLLMWTNHVWNRCRRWLGLEAVQFSTRVKFRVRAVLRALDAFEQRVADYARQHRCEGIICGHIHVPRISFRGPVNYCNTGDWVENCTALVEDLDGRLRLERFAARDAVCRDPRNAAAETCPPLPRLAVASPGGCRVASRGGPQDASPPAAGWTGSPGQAAGEDAAGEDAAGELVGSPARSRSSV